MYPYKLLNFAKRIYIINKRESLAMVYALHKFRHYLFGNCFIFYVDHMAFVYLVNNPQVYGRITRRLLLFLEYDFKIVY
jgi:hypothetical protein